MYDTYRLSVDHTYLNQCWMVLTDTLGEDYKLKTTLELKNEMVQYYCGCTKTYKHNLLATRDTCMLYIRTSPTQD